MNKLIPLVMKKRTIMPIFLSIIFIVTISMNLTPIVATIQVEPVIQYQLTIEVIGSNDAATLARHIYDEGTRATIESCDSTGTQKDLFGWHEIVYVNGSGYSSSIISPVSTRTSLSIRAYDLYIVNDVTSWVNYMPIPPRVPGTASKVFSDSSGNIPPTPVWVDPLTPGIYDILVDVNRNGLYDEGVDALDNNDIQVGCPGPPTGGFFVIPEYLIGTILGLVGFFAAFGVFRLSKRKLW